MRSRRSAAHAAPAPLLLAAALLPTAAPAPLRNDGSVFTTYGVSDVALGWPLRYAHSPAEVVDLADVAVLAGVIQAIAERW